MVKKGFNIDLSSKRWYRYNKNLTRTNDATPNILTSNVEHPGEKYTANNEIVKDDIWVHQGKKKSNIK